MAVAVDDATADALLGDYRRQRKERDVAIYGHIHAHTDTDTVTRFGCSIWRVSKRVSESIEQRTIRGAHRRVKQ